MYTAYNFVYVSHAYLCLQVELESTTDTDHETHMESSKLLGFIGLFLLKFQGF